MRTAASVVSLLVLGTAAASERPVELKDGPGKALVVASCSTCHSLDYIPMNSPFLDRKGWAATVTKMMNAMGAPVAADDVPKIVEYLATYYGKEPAPPAVRTAPPSRAATKSAPSAEVLARGKAGFEAYCISCHGPSGRGNGPVAPTLRPPPKDLTALKGGAPRVFQILGTGVSGTAMVSFTHLSEEDRWAIAHYVASLRTEKDVNAK